MGGVVGLNCFARGVLWENGLLGGEVLKDGTFKLKLLRTAKAKAGGQPYEAEALALVSNGLPS